MSAHGSRKRRGELSVAQRDGIRRVHDDPGTAPLMIPAMTLRSLVRRRLVAADAAGVYLTHYGEVAYRNIMRSGDGPEQLKQMVRLG